MKEKESKTLCKEIQWQIEEKMRQLISRAMKMPSRSRFPLARRIYYCVSPIHYLTIYIISLVNVR